MVSDAGEHVGEPGLRVDIVGASGLDQGLKDCGALTVAVQAAEQQGLQARIVGRSKVEGSCREPALDDPGLQQTTSVAIVLMHPDTCGDRSRTS